MDKESPKKETGAYAPNIFIRLILWFAIYFGAQVPFIVENPRFVGVFWCFPFGLALYIDHFCPWKSDAHWSSADWAVAIAYGFYFVHLLLSLVLRSKWSFLFLMIILIGVVSLNLFGCAAEWHGLSEIH
jgi:hypothetical protein